MTYVEATAELEALGTAQNRKVYPRHGVKAPLFGVSYANLVKLKKRIGTDHALALKLWHTCNHDARILATMIADPEQATPLMLAVWARALDNYVLSEAVSGFVSRTAFAKDMMQTWLDAAEEFVAAAGWNLVGGSAMFEKGLPDEIFRPLVERIERDIYRARNRVRYAMNSALIAIGTRSDDLEELTFNAATRIDSVDVDHGETGCKTPDAAPYIRKARAHQRKKEAKSAAA